MNRKRKRPFGVTIIALLLLVNGATAAVRVGAELFDLYHERRGDIDAGEWVALTEDLSLTEAMLLPLTVFGIVMAWGIWSLRPRAWFLTMALQGFNLAIQLYHYSRGQRPYLEMFTSLGIVFYLNQRDVQLYFRPHPPRQTRKAPDER